MVIINDKDGYLILDRRRSNDWLGCYYLFELNHSRLADLL